MRSRRAPGRSPRAPGGRPSRVRAADPPAEGEAADRSTLARARCVCPGPAPGASRAPSCSASPRVRDAGCVAGGLPRRSREGTPPPGFGTSPSLACPAHGPHEPPGRRARFGFLVALDSDRPRAESEWSVPRSRGVGGPSRGAEIRKKEKKMAHTKNKRKSNLEKHENGDARRKKDQGEEKGDIRRLSKRSNGKKKINKKRRKNKR